MAPTAGNRGNGHARLAVVSAEWLTFDEGKISSAYLLFDKARWPEVLEQLGLSAANA